MMERSRRGNSRSSGSCKMSGDSRSYSPSSSRSSGSRSDDSCSSSDSSCAHTVLVRNKFRGHSSFQCRFVSSRKNTHSRKRCKDFISPNTWTRSACCHISNEIHVKRPQNHECCTDTSREENDGECSVKKLKCQDSVANLHNCLLGSILPCNWCCGSRHKRLSSNLEPDEMTKVYSNQRRTTCDRHNCCSHYQYHITRGHFCENHLSPIGNNCRSDCTKKTTKQAAVTNAGSGKNLAGMEGHGLLQGNLTNEGLTASNNFASTRDFTKTKFSHTMERSTICCQKESKIVILDDTDDEFLQNNNPKMDIRFKNHLLQNISPQMGVHFKNHPAGVKTEEESSTSIKNSVMESLNQQAELKKERDSSTSIKRGVIESVENCTAPLRDAEECRACKDNWEGTCIKADEEAAVGALDRSEIGWCESKKQPDSSIQDSTVLLHSAFIVKDLKEAGMAQGMCYTSFKSRKKRMVDKRSLPLVEENNDESNASEASLVGTVIVEKAVLSKIVEAKPRMWDVNILCDLCRKGPSLSLGEWYAWCCGLRLHRCGCSPVIQMKLKLAISTKKSNKPKKTDGVCLSGMVHKMCALWSSEVYEEEERLQGLYDAVKRGKSLICASCREYGATLGCRVKTCRRSFHYPCADELASKLCCRMWDGVQHPVACRGHRYVSESCTNAKEKPPNLRKWRFRGFVLRKHFGTGSGTSLQAKQTLKDCGVAGGAVDYPQPEPNAVLLKEKSTLIDISSDSEDEKKMEDGRQHLGFGASNPVVLGPSDPSEILLKEHQLKMQEIGEHRLGDSSHALYHMGGNLLCEDISNGREAVLIPCTNDVDSDPAPAVNYITENRYLGRAKLLLESLLLDKTRVAGTCKGCDLNNIDNPNIEASVHAALSNFSRESDTRFDWQGQSMLGRLPYDRFGRLQLGSDTKDILECNSRCPCGVDCLNRELQRGIRTPLEVFKTKDRGWGVRTMEQICRGKFVVEYIGEVLSHDEAHVRGIEYDLSNFSCLFSADHPDVLAEDLLVIDAFRMSNVARFINHSCDGNLRVYRVYTHTTDLRFCRIGLYALRDIEIGEELSYDYGYVGCKDGNSMKFSADPTSIKCLCGASNCRQWLWTGTSQ